jgi:hypothetical protein
MANLTDADLSLLIACALADDNARTDMFCEKASRFTELIDTELLYPKYDFYFTNEEETEGEDVIVGFYVSPKGLAVVEAMLRAGREALK